MPRASDWGEFLSNLGSGFMGGLAMRKQQALAEREAQVRERQADAAISQAWEDVQSSRERRRKDADLERALRTPLSSLFGTTPVPEALAPYSGLSPQTIAYMSPALEFASGTRREGEEARLAGLRTTPLPQEMVNVIGPQSQGLTYEQLSMADPYLQRMLQEQSQMGLMEKEYGLRGDLTEKEYALRGGLEEKKAGLKGGSGGVDFRDILALSQAWEKSYTDNMDREILGEIFGNAELENAWSLLRAQNPNARPLHLLSGMTPGTQAQISKRASDLTDAYYIQSGLGQYLSTGAGQVPMGAGSPAGYPEMPQTPSMPPAVEGSQAGPSMEQQELLSAIEPLASLYATQRPDLFPGQGATMTAFGMDLTPAQYMALLYRQKQGNSPGKQVSYLDPALVLKAKEDMESEFRAQAARNTRETEKRLKAERKKR